MDVGDDGEHQGLVIALPGSVAAVGLPDLGLNELPVVGKPVLPGHHLVVILPLRDGGGGVLEDQGLCLVIVEILEPERVGALSEDLGELFLYGSVGAVVLHQELAVDIEAAAVVGRQGEAVFFFSVHLERCLQEHCVMVHHVVDSPEVDVGPGALQVRFAEGGEVFRQDPLRPVVPDFIFYGCLFRAGRQEEGRQENGRKCMCSHSVKI